MTGNVESTSPSAMWRSDGGNPVETAIEAISSLPATRSIASWTIIVYLAGDNNLGVYMENDLEALTAAGSNSDVNILVLFDREGSRDTKAYYLAGGSRTEIPLYQISSGWGSELNMGDPNTLVKFAAYCIDTHPAEHYLLVLQDHGGAWQGSCWDETSSSDRLTLSEIGNAFEAIKGHIGKRMDVVLFNSCLMANIEVLCQVQDCAEYVVASESIGWTSNWDNEWSYTIPWLKANPGSGGEQVAIYLANICHLVDSSSSVTQSVAAINMTYVPLLMNEFSNLSARANEWVSVEGEYVLSARSGSSYFVGPYTGDSDLLIDLYQFTYNLRAASIDPELDEMCGNIMDIIGPSGGSLGSMVMKHRWTSATSFSHGISVYFPSLGKAYDTSYNNGNLMAATTQWDELLLSVRGYTQADDAIWIDGDSALASMAAARGWSGTGISTDPFIISGQSIIGLDAPGIYLADISKYVVVRDNLVAAMDVHGVTSNGIEVRNSGHVTVSRNEMWNSETGILLASCNGVKVNNNTLLSCRTGIELDNTDGGQFVGNMMVNATIGVQLISSDDNEIGKNSIRDANGAISLNRSIANTISGNRMTGCGLMMDDLASILMQTVTEDNTVNGLPVLYIRDEDLGGVTRTYSAGQLILANVSNGIIQGVQLKGGSAGAVLGGCSGLRMNGCLVAQNDVGMLLLGCTDVVLDRCEIKENGEGVMAWDCVGLTITNNSISSNAGHGVDLIGCSGCLIFSNNFVSNNDASLDPSKPQANDREGSNYWYGPGRGNHWSDLTAPDINDDGIVDLSYHIGAGTDQFPLVDRVMTDSIWIESDAALIQATRANGWEGDGSPSDPIVIEGWDTVSWNDREAIHIANTTLALMIVDMIVVDRGSATTGISIINSGNISLSGCSFIGFTTSLVLIDNGNVSLTGNVLEGGLVMSGDTDSWAGLNISSGNTVSGDPLVYVHDVDMNGGVIPIGGQIILFNVSDARFGGWSSRDVTTSVILAYCDNITVQNGNVEGGLSGLIAEYCDSLAITNCTFSGGKGTGIDLKGCRNVLITNSSISHYLGFAVSLHSCVDCLVFKNRFTGNNGAGSSYTPASAQAFDDGNNEWNDAKKGNRWSDRSSPDSNGDRVVDIPYALAGDAEDLFPLVLDPSVDIESPEILITSPLAGSRFTTDAFSVVWDASDNESGITSLQMFIDGVETEDVTGRTATSITDLADGPHTVLIKAMDGAGNSRGAAVNIIIDARPPRVSFASPLNLTAINIANPVISWVMVDDGSGISSTMFSVDGGPVSLANGDARALEGLAEGWHQFMLEATDLSGHSTIYWLDFFVDLTKPEVGVSGAPSGIVDSHSLTIAWASWDNQSGIAWSGYKLDSGPWRSKAPGDLTLTNIADGTHDIVLAAVDAAGNRQEIVLTFMVDADPPMILMDPGLNSSAFKGVDVAVSWTAADLGAGLKCYQVRIDGGEWFDVGLETGHLFTDLVEAYHSVEVKATDLVGHAIVAQAGFWVDMTAPDLTIISPLDGNISSSNETILQWQLSEGGSPVMVLVQVDDDEMMAFSGLNEAVLLLGEGEHVLRFTAIDLAGNNISRSINITLDRTAPVLVDHGPIGSNVTLADHIWLVANEPISASFIRVNGVERGTVISDTICRGFLSMSYDTDYAVEVTIQDAAGNRRELAFSFHTTDLAVFSGRVLDEKGIPISGAIVSAGRASCVTDANGSFQLTALYNITTISVTARGMQTLEIGIAESNLGDVTMRHDGTPMIILLLAIILAACAVLVIVVWLKRRK
ncbi:MAG: Clostripain family protein [Methanomassiliicoccales archaeon PtaU1.Bin124]|nr:MAG: Clostripain family protein [Methanomassiliicoccales archaeon PtaU1.Bin124]